MSKILPIAFKFFMIIVKKVDIAVKVFKFGNSLGITIKKEVSSSTYFLLISEICSLNNDSSFEVDV